ncbi:MAG: Efflux ABC transporter, permease protein, partial [uncultured Thermoleophilia bacterium]
EHDEDPGRPAAGRARLRRAAAAARAALGLPHLRLARHAQDQARARAARRRDDHARAVPAHVHLPLRRGPGGLHQRVPAVPAARHPRAVRAVHLGLLRRDAQHRHDQGRGRPLPVAGHLAPGAAGRRRPRGRGALRDRGDGRRPSRPRARLPPGGRGPRDPRRDGPRDRVLVRPGLGVHHPRVAAPLAERGHEHGIHGPVPPDLPVQRVRRPEHPAQRARGLRRPQPHLPPGHRHPRTHGRRSRHRRDRHRPGRHRGPHRRLRAAHLPPLPAREL